jgi:APA family basic amino acid/polyamine antiporter
MYMLPIGEMAQSSFVASDAIQRALGSGAAISVAVLIVICTFGAVSVNLLTNARVIFLHGTRWKFLFLGRRCSSKISDTGKCSDHTWRGVVFLVTQWF